MKQTHEKFDVLIVDDHAVVRLGLSGMLAHVSCINSIEQAANGEEALDLIRKRNYSFVFMDIKMPVMDGIAATSIITKEYPDINVIALSVFDDNDYIKAMFSSGAKGYLLKNTDMEEIENAINKILSGALYASPTITETLLNGLGPSNKNECDVPLTQREREVLKYLWQGLTSNDVARKMLLSKKSIDLCRSQLLEKIKCKNSVELFRYALKHNLVSQSSV